MLLYLFLFFQIANGWHQWNYKTEWSGLSATEAFQLQQEWYKIWGTQNSTYSSTNAQNAPRPRRGHSLVLFHSPNIYPYYGESYIIMFGGRDNDAYTSQIPKTYNLEVINNTLEFTTYDAKPVIACNDANLTYFTAAERAACLAQNESGYESTIKVGVFYNDVWAYKLCNNTPPYRYFNGPCEDTGWVLWSAGAREGGCEYKLNLLMCSTPSERYNHGAVVFDDGSMVVYGGFSQRCADYCDDLWMFDVFLRVWRQVYYTGTLSRLYDEVLFDGSTAPYPAVDVPVDSGGWAGPGKRWRHSMALGEVFLDADGIMKQPMAVFGGHRLWQGFSQENSEANSWNNYTTRPLGGYLDDLWVYSRLIDNTSVPGIDLLSYDGRWEQKQPVSQCESTPGVTWESRDAITCAAVWPAGRAGHSSAYDSQRNRIWIFGGYATYFPYLSTGGEGSGPGTSSTNKGFTPYPDYDYYKNDLWYYNISSGLWTEIIITDSALPQPKPRMDSVFLLVGDVLFLHGGYGNNQLYDDTWYFNISSSTWLQKKEFVTAIFPAACTDDTDYIRQNNCTLLEWPKHLERDNIAPFAISDYSVQPFYWPNATDSFLGLLFPIGTDYNSTFLLPNMLPSNGTPLFPFAATGPLQFVRSFIFPFNSTYNVTLLESCTSVFSEPTRGRTLDGLFGRANASIFIAQPRRQRVDWDGCRGRYDGRTDLPEELQYVRPKARFGHRAVYNADAGEILMYGGMAFIDEHAASVQDSFPAVVSDEMWFYSLHHCQNNCSLHGDCFLGYCLCDSGYYGIDCSNSSCPGTFCQYDSSLKQQCVHACQAGYVHTDADIYVADIAKLPCSANQPGESNGICDGFGTSYCAPPFIGDDCGTKDCQYNCSFNGYCSVEYPVSRCICMPGYFGEYCQKYNCLNNCTYPNGICNITTGMCNCNMMFSPYNNSRPYKPWGGDDCSYLYAYAAAYRSCIFSYVPVAVASLFILCLILIF